MCYLKSASVGTPKGVHQNRPIFKSIKNLWEHSVQWLLNPLTMTLSK